MDHINIYQAKTQLSRLIARVENGEAIVIAKAGKPVARLLPIEGPAKRIFGQDAGLYEIPEDFDDPLPAETMRDFGL